jgi:hypothetical protein
MIIVYNIKDKETSKNTTPCTKAIIAISGKGVFKSVHQCVYYLLSIKNSMGTDRAGPEIK